MHDLKFLRDNLNLFEKGLKNKNTSLNLDEIVVLDNRRRELIKAGDQLKYERNQTSIEIGELKKKGQSATDKISQMQDVGLKIQNIETELQGIEQTLNQRLSFVPNLPHPSVQIGTDAQHNVEVRKWGKRKYFDFEPLDHLSLGEKLGILDFKRGAKLSGSGFPLYKGAGASLERALITFMLDRHVREHGYLEIFPPFLVSRQSMFGTGQLPKMEKDMYHCPEDDLFPIPTAEVPLTNIHRDEILMPNSLPIKYVAYSACFRREAGSYGKDTRGFLRVHQFNKVELVKFVMPDNSYDELESLVKDAESILQALDLEYRVVQLCTGDLSFAAAKCYDLEIYSPAEKKYLEVSSCSNFEDFQARRTNIRFRDQQGNKVRFVHTLNGSGVATSRLMVALLETYQTPSGSVIIPDVLRSYMHGSTEIC